MAGKLAGMSAKQSKTQKTLVKTILIIQWNVFLS
jgi:hypothetical protein